MTIVPWTMGRGMRLPVSPAQLGSIGPIAAGIFVERIELSTLSLSITSMDIQITKSESRAREIGDMVNEAPLFRDGDSTVAEGLQGVRCRTTSIINFAGSYGWGFEVLTGPMWINIAVSNIGASFNYLFFSAFGFRRIKADEDP